jgi:hypothetical protein
MAKRNRVWCIRAGGVDIHLAEMTTAEIRELVIATRYAVRHNRPGWVETKRQIRVARRLYDVEGANKLHWKEMNATQKRPYLDRACQGEHADEMA